jgi:hypothetical protein
MAKGEWCGWQSPKLARQRSDDQVFSRFRKFPQRRSGLVSLQQHRLRRHPRQEAGPLDFRRRITALDFVLSFHVRHTEVEGQRIPHPRTRVTQAQLTFLKGGINTRNIGVRVSQDTVQSV